MDFRVVTIYWSCRPGCACDRVQRRCDRPTSARLLPPHPRTEPASGASPVLAAVLRPWQPASRRYTTQRPHDDDVGSLSDALPQSSPEAPLPAVRDVPWGGPRHASSTAHRVPPTAAWTDLLHRRGLRKWSTLSDFLMSCSCSNYCDITKISCVPPVHRSADPETSMNEAGIRGAAAPNAPQAPAPP